MKVGLYQSRCLYQRFYINNARLILLLSLFNIVSLLIVSFFLLKVEFINDTAKEKLFLKMFIRANILILNEITRSFISMEN